VRQLSGNTSKLNETVIYTSTVPSPRNVVCVAIAVGRLRLGAGRSREHQRRPQRDPQHSRGVRLWLGLSLEDPGKSSVRAGHAALLHAALGPEDKSGAAALGLPMTGRLPVPSQLQGRRLRQSAADW